MTLNKKIKVAVLFGGKSAEHEVSIQSAKYVISALEKGNYDVLPIKIGKNGVWKQWNDDNTKIKSNTMHREESLSPCGLLDQDIDVVFPVLHGPFGEDGTIQGFLKAIDIAFVGAGVLGSSMCMDKDIMKRLLQHADLPVGNFVVAKIQNKKELDFKSIIKTLELPLFVKPANLGSSIGISKVENEQDFHQAVEEAFLYDTKIIIEEFIDGREIECSMLGNEEPIASVCGEVVTKDVFYSYAAKYSSTGQTELLIPAPIDTVLMDQTRILAIQAYKALCCEGFARVDFFLTKEKKIYINEINTIPGFTETSMFPKLWEATGMDSVQLVSKLIELAIARHEQEKNLQTSQT